MYVEQEIYSEDGDMLEKMLIQKNKSEDVSMWILGPSSFGL